MTNDQIVTDLNAEKNAQFLAQREASDTEKRYQRHSLQARITHAAAGISCILLCITGLFVFVPALTQMLPSNVVFGIRMSHRVLGAIFIIVPLISALMAPKGVAHIFKELFAKWTEDDKKWMALFMPYLFLAKWLHMPDQDESKSGQRFADGAIWVCCLLMAVTGVLLVFKGALGYSGAAYGVILWLHDLGFLLICVFGLAHIFLGAGIFQPYRGMGNVMYGDGTISESDFIYHWGHFARKRLEDGEGVIEVPKKK